MINAHIHDVIEWHSVELPGCEGEGVLDLDARPDVARLFTPALRQGESANEQTHGVGHRASAGVTVSHTVALPNGNRDTARINFF